ncbi:MAG: SprT-like domain-containing protein [Sphingobacteriaceae bacterium]|nr:SprT-like domain-containing protein [Sphingobacteriaceae bacterium]
MDARAVQFQRNSEILKKYLPEQAVPIIAEWIITYDFKLKIKRERNTKLGDYMSPLNGMNHVITINHNLNKYSFLITLVHEIAHLVTYNEFKNRVNPHGVEWRMNFKKLMVPFLTPDIFPIEVFSALRKYMANPAASSCSDIDLLRVLKLHDENTGMVFVERLPAGAVFLYRENKIFKKGEKIRKRYKCVEITTGFVYLFNPLTEVSLFEETNDLSKL